MTTKYISYKAVLHDLSLTLDERYWNENKISEWVVHAYRKLDLPLSLEQQTTLLTVTTHKATLPANFKYLIQIVDVTTPTSETSDTFLEDTTDLPSESTWTLASTNSLYGYVPMRLSSNPFHSSICLDTTISYCTDCAHEFSISPNLVITTTLETGTILVAYLGYATDENGLPLIPDDENLKEALLYYVLYRYWMEKDLMMEQGAAQRADKYLSLWQVASVKAKGNLTSPDINELENIKAHWNRLVPRENKFQQFFATLGNRENVNF